MTFARFATFLVVLLLIGTPAQAESARPVFEGDHQEWAALARAGNPYVLVSTRGLGNAHASFTAPTPLQSGWQYRKVAEYVVVVAFAAADPESPVRGRKDLIDYSMAAVEWLLSEMRPDTWWQPGRLEGDPNVNRFVLGPLLDAVRWLRMLPEGEAAWSRWRTRLGVAVEFQRRAYRGEVHWDWAALAAGRYANQDAYFALILALSADLFRNAEDDKLVAQVLKALRGNVLPSGGIRYIGNYGPSPIYQALTTVVLARVYWLTKNLDARAVIEASANYWCLVLTPYGEAEHWSNVWWKQDWHRLGPEPLTVVAALSGDRRVQALLLNVLNRTAPSDVGGMWAIYAAPWWRKTQQAAPLSGRFLVIDENIRGFRGRSGQWHYGLGLGRGLVASLAGGQVLAKADFGVPSDTFHGARFEIGAGLLGPILWLSQSDFACEASVKSTRVAAAASDHALRSTPRNPLAPTGEEPSGWRGVQLWLGTERGLIGLLEARGEPRAVVRSVRGQIDIRSDNAIQTGLHEWTFGELAVQLLWQSPADGLSVRVARHIERSRLYQLSLEWEAPLSRSETRYRYAIWVGPALGPRPARFDAFEATSGFVAAWGDGRAVRAVFNSSCQPALAFVPWDKSMGAEVRSSSWGVPQFLTPSDGALPIRLDAGALAIVEQPADRQR